MVEQEDIPRTHSINVNGEMSQLCVPNAIRHMFISTVAVKPKQEAAGKTTKKG